MNYGHPLQFGTFITPRNDAPEEVVALARRSEELGYDLVTFQDHPYQSAYLDTWTLLSWVAGQTERIHIAANVLNLPLRPPAVLARAAASLDLLSGGRLELALGAGAFWDAIEANGGRRLAPGEAVNALSEAIDIIRAIFDTSEDGPLHYNGDFYRLSGVQSGPTAAHDIPIWVGGGKERMLRLIGRKADGWLPTQRFMQLSDLRAGNVIIDEAARAAGRDPCEIRRLLNISGEFSTTRSGFLQGPSAQWVEDLLPLVVEEGFSTFILMSDDTATLEQFAHEVAPALREAALAALPELANPPLIRRAAIRAKRRPAIDYDHVPPVLADAVIEPGDAYFGRVKSTYLRGGSPGIIFMVKNTEQVRAALEFARAHRHLPLSIRSGGHGISGRSTNDGGIVINLSKMNSIEVLDRATRRVRIGPGARWMEVAAALAPYGWALSSGDYGGVGVGGLATAGGVGWLARKHGLTIDHLVAVEMVLADGSVVRASAEENSDLFWAVRGAGANFGIVTAFEFEVYEVGNVGFAQFVYDASDTANLLQEWGAVVEASPRDLTSFLIMGPPRRGQPFVAQAMTMVASDDPQTIISQLQPLANIAPLYDQSVFLASYANIMANAQGGDYNGRGEPVGRSALVDHITTEFAAAAANLLRSGAVYFFQIRSVGGAVADVDPAATAYANRSPNFSVTAFGTNRQRLDKLWDEMAHHFNGLYISFETDLRPDRLQDAFPGETLERLRKLKAHYDPDNLFRDNFNVVPERAAQETAAVRSL
jgi:alkanesulfonate monooxygenase SsuD/methylene tetrahydromethanopterin reductase-like flavin-dependent oxidoreductase (luciferase family)